MTEHSYLWTTGGAGDGASTYTRTDWTNILKVLGAMMDEEGVAAAYLNALVGSVTGANTVSISTGGALVDGRPYYNDAAQSVNIPSAAGGGNTRIDRIVLRADYTLQTVRIQRIAGTDAASPTAPAITQTTGVTYDVLLYQALVNTSGTVTLTGERLFAVPGPLTVGTTAMALNSVDDTIAGNRVPQFYRRQGADASDWTQPGTTSYTPTAVRMQAGSISIASGGTVTITFPTAFSQIPLGFVVITGSVGVAIVVSTSTTQMVINAYNLLTGTALNASLFWWAVGTE